MVPAGQRAPKTLFCRLQFSFCCPLCKMVLRVQYAARGALFWICYLKNPCALLLIGESWLLHALGRSTMACTGAWGNPLPCPRTCHAYYNALSIRDRKSSIVWPGFVWRLIFSIQAFNSIVQYRKTIFQSWKYFSIALGLKKSIPDPTRHLSDICPLSDMYLTFIWCQTNVRYMSDLRLQGQRIRRQSVLNNSI